VIVVSDTAPLVAASNRRDVVHAFASALVTAIGRDLLIPLPVVVEVDQVLRARVGPHSARAFLSAVASGDHTVAFTTPGLLRRSVEIDRRFADLDLGLADASVMALAEREDLPILTFDFADFRAATLPEQPWKLVVDEARYREATAR
jgi:uncharacterized protein